ncbi:putative ribonuclease III [Rhodotorula toruloides ATCC 204091]|uniref:Putative ribonuclease III n=1 Tax=Rhodotorula toruloides TaxID=5286 RepID=A0A0K3CHL5_RHOTO|nr:putative ribonuclease III [Rhodotorula toruloides ATCC 204091]KAK4331700.1 putative ribonuclease III [Rhodotorula toruloides]PRQ73112.1 putative ribonuclease III [Rhodotorula toruloides]
MEARAPHLCEQPSPPNWQPPLFTFRPDRLPSLPAIADSLLHEQALRHISAIPEMHHQDPLIREGADWRSNRRLEWEGDSALSWLVSRELARQFPTATSGDLSSLRQGVVSNRTLSHLAWTYGFGGMLKHKTNLGPDRPAIVHQKIMADAFEAYLGAASTVRASQGTLRDLETFIQRMLDPACVEGLVEAAASLRAHRLQPDNPVPLVQQPRRSLQRDTLPASSLRDGTDIGWVENSLGGRWSATLSVAGRPIVTVEAPKRLEAQQRAVNIVLNRLLSHSQIRAVVLEALQEA